MKLKWSGILLIAKTLRRWNLLWWSQSSRMMTFPHITSTHFVFLFFFHFYFYAPRVRLVRSYIFFSEWWTSHGKWFRLTICLGNHFVLFSLFFFFSAAAVALCYLTSFWKLRSVTRTLFVAPEWSKNGTQTPQPFRSHWLEDDGWWAYFILLNQLMILQSFSPRVKVKANGAFIISIHFDPIKSNDHEM